MKQPPGWWQSDVPKAPISLDGAIMHFTGENRWLSNFWPSAFEFPIWGHWDPDHLKVGASLAYGDLKFAYKTNEHFYQAFKTLDLVERQNIVYAATPAEAKKLGGSVNLRKDWDSIKVEVMRYGLGFKFSIPDLRKRLIDTGDAFLVEANWWGDTFWGVCQGRGRNMLGNLLMEIRGVISKIDH